MLFSVLMEPSSPTRRTDCVTDCRIFTTPEHPRKHISSVQKRATLELDDDHAFPVIPTVPAVAANVPAHIPENDVTPNGFDLLLKAGHIAEDDKTLELPRNAMAATINKTINKKVKHKIYYPNIGRWKYLCDSDIKDKIQNSKGGMVRETWQRISKPDKIQLLHFTCKRMKLKTWCVSCLNNSKNKCTLGGHMLVNVSARK